MRLVFLLVVCFRLLCQVELAHDPVKGIVGRVRFYLAGGFFEALYLFFICFLPIIISPCVVMVFVITSPQH
ncbi:hypothetical protein TQ29_17240 [Actibacterium sp. EMB200-NS6]|nr:hypothetical protein TQ29_17240 [Actibacterium sp. EMB200-NS6]